MKPIFFISYQTMKMINYCVFKKTGSFTELLFEGEQNIPTAFITNTHHPWMDLIPLHLFAKRQTLHEIMFYLICITNQIFSSYNSRRKTNI